MGIIYIHSQRWRQVLQRTRLKERSLPNYTKGEEIFNMVSHAVGAAFGVFALVTCVITAAKHQNAWSMVSGVIYGVSLLMLYTVSSVYHGLPRNTGKKVMQVIDHCVIYLLICGTYTPIVLCALRTYSPVLGWGLFGAVWGVAALGAVFTAIDLKKYAVLSMICYIGIGWCVVFAIKPLLKVLPWEAFMWLLAGGIAYTVGAVLYGLGSRHRYMHSVFHLFVLAGSVMHYVAIIKYIL